MTTWKVHLVFAHLNGWSKDVIVAANTKRKAMILAEKIYPQGKADESLTKELKEKH